MTTPLPKWLDKLSGREFITVATRDIDNYSQAKLLYTGDLLKYTLSLVDILNEYFIDGSIVFRCEQEKITNVEAVRVYVDTERSRPIAVAFSAFVDFVQIRKLITTTARQFIKEYESILRHKYPELIWYYADEAAQNGNYILDFNEACKLFL